MNQLQKYGYLFVAVVISVMDLSTQAYAGTTRLSLNPYGVAVGNGASVIQSGFDAPIRLPKSGNPTFAIGFTIPLDYVANTPLKVQILWETPSTACSFFLGTSFLFRARAGQPQDSGSASAGLLPVNASTTFTVIGDGIRMDAPATAQQTARVRFDIMPTPSEFPTLQAGDAVNFGLSRHSADANDTCSEELGIAGISIGYTTP